MHSGFRLKRDYYSGALITLIGVGAAFIAQDYRFGSLTHMGPGFFPLILGAILTLLGILIAGAALLDGVHEEEPFFRTVPEWRGWFCIVAGPILFIVFGKYFGLAPASFACVFVSALGDRTTTLKGALILAACITFFGIVLFSFVLHISFPIFRVSHG
jgi:hypothetical protein